MMEEQEVKYFTNQIVFDFESKNKTPNINQKNILKSRIERIKKDIFYYENELKRIERALKWK